MREHRQQSAQTGEEQSAAQTTKPGASTLPYRDQMEQAFGQDFSSVQVQTGQQQLGGIGATGAARGETVSFADGNPTPWLVAHELAHVVQHRGGSGNVKPGTIAKADSTPELEANRVADRVAGG